MGRRRVLLAATGLLIAGLVPASSQAFAGSSARSNLVPASIVRAFDASGPEGQKAIFLKLTRAQQVAMFTPASAQPALTFRPADAAAPTLQEGVAGVNAPLVGLGDNNLQAAGKKCGPYTFPPGNWEMPVKAIAGNTLYVWHLDTTWTGNCQTITRLDYHFTYYDQAAWFEELKGGSKVDIMSGKGAPSGNATGSGIMQACFPFSFLTGCFASSNPRIHEVFDAWGGRDATGSA